VRALIVLMSAAGQSGEQIAATLGITRRTVTNARARWRRNPRTGLQEGRHSGRPPRANAEYLARLYSVVERDPREFGFAFTRWTAPRHATYLARETGVRMSPVWVEELLRLRRRGVGRRSLPRRHARRRGGK
jgi:transposase